MWNVPFYFFTWWITLIDFWILKQPCGPEIKPIWSWHVILCVYLLKLRVLSLCFRGILVCHVLSLWCPVSRDRWDHPLLFGAQYLENYCFLYFCFRCVWGGPTLCSLPYLARWGSLLDSFLLHFECEILGYQIQHVKEVNQPDLWSALGGAVNHHFTQSEAWVSMTTALLD